MRRHLTTAAAIVVACGIAAGCDLLNREKKTPTDPTPAPTVSLDAFAGTWNSTAPSTPATGCGNLKYTVTPVSASSANVTFAATCASSVGVTGTGTGSISGSTLNWTAAGLVSQGGVNCPFTLTNGKATQETDGTVKVVYSGTVCGIPVSGTEIVKK
jgi:hypothetical protein